MEIIHERAKLRLMDGNDVETLFSIVEGNREIWAYLISKMDSVQDMRAICSKKRYKVMEKVRKYLSL